MPQNNLTPKPPRLLLMPPKKHWSWWWLVATLGLVAVGAFAFWPKGSGCIVDDNKVYAKEPSIRHFFTGEEGLKYRINKGKLIPFNDSKPLVLGGKTYEVHISVDEKFVNPVFGSEIKGRVWLTENGRTIDRPPRFESVNAAYPVFESSVPVTITGIKSGRLDANSSAPATVSKMPVLPGRLPYPITHLYANRLANAAYTSPDLAPRELLDLSDGPVEFGLVYFGTREMPYLEIEVGSSEYGNDVVYDSRVVCFTDQRSPYTPRLPQIDGPTKGEFYYQLEANVSKLTAGKSQRVRLDITARDTRNGGVLSDPLQRVRVLAWPVNNVQWLATGKTGAIEGGAFVDNADADRVVQDKNFDQFTKIYSWNKDVLNQKMMIPALAELDLIQGKGTVFFDYSGSAGNKEVPSRLTFVVQPTSYALDQSDLSRTNPDRLPYRIKQQIRIPDRPADNLDIRTSRTNYSPIVSRTTDEFAVLYRSWQSNTEFINGIYTITSIPIDGSYTSKAATNWYWTWLWSLAAVQMLGGAALIFQARKKKKLNGRK